MKALLLVGVLILSPLLTPLPALSAEVPAKAYCYWLLDAVDDTDGPLFSTYANPLALERVRLLQECAERMLKIVQPQGRRTDLSAQEMSLVQGRLAYLHTVLYFVHRRLAIDYAHRGWGRSIEAAEHRAAMLVHSLNIQVNMLLREKAGKEEAWRPGRKRDRSNC